MLPPVIATTVVITLCIHWNQTNMTVERMAFNNSLFFVEVVAHCDDQQ